MSKLRVGVAGPVGSGKTALVEALCRRLRDRLQLAVVTNDIYTQEDAQFLTRAGALEPERIRGVETGGCPHTAIREDCSINRAAVAELEEAYLYGWTANQISAAVRLVPLGATEGQRLQLQLAPLIAERAAVLAAADPRTLWSGGVGAGLAQLRQAELYSRLFRS